MKEQPWIPSDATDIIREIAQNPSDLMLVEHSKERMRERDILMGDVLYVLRNGYVYEDPSPSTRKGLYKYKIESKSPNSGSRKVRVIVIPDAFKNIWKIITVMFVDE